MANWLAAITVKFRLCHIHTARWEGGWSNHKADPGGKTMLGVTEAKFHEWLRRHNLPIRPVRTITKDEALAIYFHDYWQALNCETLFAGVDLATYDAGVNSGPGRARKWLLASLDKQNRHDLTVKAICAKRLGFVQTLAHFATFKRGWTNRIADIQAKGVLMALQAMGQGKNASEILEGEAVAKSEAAKKQSWAGGATGAGGMGSAVALDAAPAQPNPTGLPMSDASGLASGDWVLVGLLVCGVLLALWFFWRAGVNRAQARAYHFEGALHVA